MLIPPKRSGCAFSTLSAAFARISASARMMPDMDGYDTMRAIRKNPRFKDLPIIAVTAKAMKGDREKTLEAGAWDYLSKPVDPDHMLSVMRAWLYR